MKIEIIDEIQAFIAIRENWEKVYDADPQAQFFISWVWIFSAIKNCNQFEIPWSILAATNSNDTDYVGFLPLTIEIKENKQGIFYNQLSIAGTTDAEHPGFLCLPAYEAEIVLAFAQYLQQQELWSVLEIRDINRENQRLNRFFSSFTPEFDVREFESESYQNPLDSVDNQIIPYVVLPNSWELYLNTISPNTRQKIRRFLRKIETSEFQITNVDEENLELHIEILTDFWQASWESRKGEQRCNSLVKNMAFELRHCFEHNCLSLPVLWQRERPLGAIANLLDFNKKTVLFLVGGRDETFKRLPAGFVLQAYAIRDAIQNGFKIYDFLMGNEAYKYSFGAKERYIHSVVVERRHWSELNIKLDVRTLPAAFKIAQNYHRANFLDEAERGYRQILAVQSQHPEALYELSAILQRQGKEREAEDLLERLLKIQPDNIKVWFGLGVLHQTHGRLSAAEKAYRQALNLQASPAIASAIYHNLGSTLQDRGQLDEAIACYQQARKLQPNSIEAEVVWANALHLQGKLSPEKQIEYAVANNELGNKRRQANDLQTALEYYRQALVLDPNLVEAHYNLGLLLEKNPSNWEEAIACYQTALKLQPDFWLADVALVNLLYTQGKLSAEKQIEYAVANNDVGNYYLQADELELAIAHYRQAIALDANLAEAYYNLGCSLYKQSEENIQESICYCQKALELKPNFLLASVYLANLLDELGELSGEQRIEQAAANYNLGNKYMEAGEFDAAAEYYKTAVRFNPKFTEARSSLRLALEQKEKKTIKVSRVRQA